MSLLSKFLPRTEFSSYEDFRENLKITTPPAFNFAYDVVDVYAKTEPGRRALLWASAAGELQEFTFADMKRESDKAAQVFAANGIRKGDAVMLALKNHYEFWFCVNALHKVGAVAVPATHMLTEHDLEYRFERAQIKMLVVAPDKTLPGYIDAVCRKLGDAAPLCAMIREQREGWLDFSAAMAAQDGNWVRPTGEAAPALEDTMMLYFSSGTTGMPKMVAHDYRYPLAHIVTAVFWHTAHDGGLHYTIADTGWAKSVWGNLYGQWIAGSAVFVHNYEKFNPAHTLELCAKVKLTSLCAPPTIYRFLIKEDISKYDFSHLEYATVAGEPLNPEVFHRFFDATGLKLMECYGQTEMTVGVGNFMGMEPKPGSMGRPSPLYNIRLEKADGSPCEVGEHGELVVPLVDPPSPGLFQAYHRNPEATAHSTRGGVYHTGDVAWQDEDGYLWYVGRDDDLIKSSGYRIGPFEVESALMTHPAVTECAVTGVPDPDRGAIVKATIVLSKGYTGSETLTRELQEHVKKATAPYKYPRVIEYVEALPKTISGKIRRVEIRQKDAQS